MDRYDIYNVQSGQGFVRNEEEGRVYVTPPCQRGRGGVGSFLVGVFRRALPLVTKNAKTVGKEALHGSVDILSDVALQNLPIREAFRSHVIKSGKKLKRKAEEKLNKLMESLGYKRSRRVD